MKVSKLPFSVFVFLLLAAGCKAPTITGVVTDEDNRPLQDVQIYFVGSQGEDMGSTKTDSSGRYSTYVPASKLHGIAVYKPGYLLQTHLIAEGSTSSRNFSLSPFRTYSKGDRVRVLDSRWCPGTIIEFITTGEFSSQYRIALDPQPLRTVEIITELSRIRPLKGDRPSTTLPCSYFEKNGPS